MNVLVLKHHIRSVIISRKRSGGIYRPTVNRGAEDAEIETPKASREKNREGISPSSTDYRSLGSVVSSPEGLGVEPWPKTSAF